MTPKLLLILCTAIVLSFSPLASAGLIQADYTAVNDNLAVYDDKSGITWLDLSLTANMSYNHAGTAFTGWRHATNSEIASLFQNNFTAPTYNPSGYQTSILATTELGLEAKIFQQLFGLSFTSTSTTTSFGLYSNEDGVLNIAGVVNDTYDGNLEIYGPDYANDFNAYRGNGSQISGTYLVRSDVEVVPEPATLAIFALGMIGLASRRFKKQF
ncbi:PEP-CTERM sorting domain-containing protein [Colwellia sp. 6_MG-2023]|uniref:PEP-CTERM sorting domain-containing protein n=1 Tax=Colwellia sp. 6_MG-2023 TaxID=3062676 RepID=UPI0026E2DEBB|nr:PEP-CTERM sorting domain-containing protein [Colwellia sp. 6_MG-2023]MDO6488693.1 PEP-CTERM sorting domain-containing protein [Colwellia sp. 6_MG-2023]